MRNIKFDNGSKHQQTNYQPLYHTVEKHDRILFFKYRVDTLLYQYHLGSSYNEEAQYKIFPTTPL